MKAAGHSTVHGEINYVGDMSARPCFHANDRSLDRVTVDSRIVTITDARDLADAPTLSREGIALVAHPTEVLDFRDAAEVGRVYPEETRRLIQALTGADAVVISSPPILRFGERSQEAGSRDNSRAARLVHIDTSDATAAQFAQRVAPSDARRVRRVAQHNIWRTLGWKNQSGWLGRGRHRCCRVRCAEPRQRSVAAGSAQSLAGLRQGANDERWRGSGAHPG